MPYFKLEKIQETKKRSDKPTKLPSQGGSKTKKVLITTIPSYIVLNPFFHLT